MLKKYNDEYFEELNVVAQNRLSPVNLSLFIWVSLFMNGLVVGISVLGFGDLVMYRYSFLPVLVKILVVTLIIHLIIAIFYTFDKNAFRYQRLQIIVASISAYTLSICFYFFFLVNYIYSFAPEYVLSTALILFIGGIIFLGLSTIRAIRRVRQGAFKKNGPGLFNYKKSKSYISLPIIFVFTMFGGVVARATGDISFDSELYIILLLSVFLQYAMALALPEFFLIAYCKFRFKSFIVPSLRTLQEKGVKK